MENGPLLTEDTIVFGLLMLLLAFVFYTSSIKKGFWKKFYKYVPALLMCYLLPAIANSIGLIDAEGSMLYFVASRFLLPASLVLMTLSIDLKAIFNLGPKALIMFFTGTVGILIGGPIAVLIISAINPEIFAATGFNSVWRGLATVAGSWIGGGANQAAMLEIFHYNPEKYGAMVFMDIIIANLWMATILLGIGRSKAIDRWLKSDVSAIEKLKNKVSDYSASIARKPSLSDYMIMFGIALGAVGFAHWGADGISHFLKSNFEIFNDKGSAFSSFTSTFFWMITISTFIGILLSFTKARKYEGAGASKLGSVFIYILVATIGMKMDLTKILDQPWLIGIGLIWISIHAGLLILVAKLIKAPYFFLAVGSQANVGGAASAPVVASAYHPSLATVGVLLAVLGYVVGTWAAYACTILMRFAAGG